MKCIVSLSGGRDSSTCLGLAVERYGAENVYAMGFEYGSKHPQELQAAKKIAEYYGVPYQIVTIDSSIFTGSTSSLLKSSNKEVQKDKTYEEILAVKEGKVDTYVPFRNGLFSSYVAAKAESLVQQFNDDVVIMLGQHADDSGYYVDENGNEMLDETKAAYPDCTVKFHNKILTFKNGDVFDGRNKITKIPCRRWNCFKKESGGINFRRKNKSKWRSCNRAWNKNKSRKRCCRI